MSGQWEEKHTTYGVVKRVQLEEDENSSKVLFGVFDSGPEELLHFGFDFDYNHVGHFWLNMLQDAIRDDRKVRIKYDKVKNEETNRIENIPFAIRLQS